MKKRKKKHLIELAAEHASFDIIGFITKKNKEATTKHEKGERD